MIDIHTKTYIASIASILHHDKRKNTVSKRKGIQEGKSNMQQIRTCMENQASKGTQERISSSVKGYSLKVALPSFFFSPNFFVVLMSLDDFCFQINPTLWSVLIH